MISRSAEVKSNAFQIDTKSHLTNQHELQINILQHYIYIGNMNIGFQLAAISI